MRMTNPLTTQYRQIEKGSAFVGALVFGPFYFMFKGHWGAGVLTLAVTAPILYGLSLLGNTMLMAGGLFIYFAALGYLAYDFMVTYWDQQGFRYDAPASGTSRLLDLDAAPLRTDTRPGL